MKKTLIPLTVLFSAILLIAACKPSKYASPEAFKGNKISWGTGGGFSNITTTYSLLPNGQLFKKSSGDGSVVEMPAVSKGQAKKVFDMIKGIDLMNMSFNKPGSLSQFIEFATPAGSNKVVFGDESNKPDQSVLDLYTQLGQVIKSSKSSM